MARGLGRWTVVSQAAVLFAFWFALSGRTEPLFLVIGAVTAIGVTAVTARIMAVSLHSDSDDVAIHRIPLALLRAVAFAFWMAGRMLVASVQLARILLSPKMPLDPCWVRFRTELRSALARTTLTNSISLVPGTLTVDIEGSEILVHAISPRAVDDLVSGRLQNKIAGVFLEGPQPPIDASQIRREGPK